MEAVPKLPLINFDLKTSPENTNFGPKLKQYIAEAYREDPESYANETHQMECLRSVAVRPTMDEEGLSGLYKYFCQLRSLQSRFPMAKGQPAACLFSWKDLYANMACALSDIRFEMACILYNIGALHSYLGASEPRTSADSLKAACTHYQNAAWAFQYLKEQYPQPPGVDVSTELMRLLQKICFAQAQECILEKSIQDTRKPSVIGAVATQVLLFYKNALAVLGPSAGTDNVHEIIGTKQYNSWHRYLSFKSSYIGCIVCLYQGMNAEEQQKMGERVAFYQQAVERLGDARKLAKYIEPAQVTQEALIFTNDVVEGKRKAAKNENEFIYHEEVPEKDQLVEMKPVCLVKALPINFNDPEISGPDVFARLVPICAHEASSMYSEEKAKILRHIVTQAESKNTELTEFMSSLQLDQLEVIDSDQKIPQEIVDRCAAMNAKSEIIQTLVDSMNSLAEIISDVEHSLSEVKTLIQEETMKEKEYQKSMGPRPPSIVQTELSREYHKYHEAHTRTNESNQVLHKAMTLHIANLKLLSQPLEDLQSKIPSIDNIEGLDRETMAEMRRVVGKAREMQAQRDSLIQNLREDITNDDITSQLLARSSEPAEDIFKEELEKHTPKVKIIEQNLVAQENIINKLTSLYAAYGESRRLLTDVLRKREGLINALITSYEAYEELLAKSQKGIEFYKKLLHNVNQLLTRLKGTCQVQEEERSQLLAKNTKPSTPTPSVVPKPSEVAAMLPPSGAPLKLKDYLPYMKNRTSRGGTPQAMEPMPADTYYPESIYPTSIRPAPVGSEATDLQMQLPDGVMPQMQPNLYDRYATPYAPENDPYASQHGYAYPATSKYDKSEEIYGYSSSYTPHQFSAHMSDPSQQSYSNPYYAATHNNTTIVTDSQGSMQYPNPQTSNHFANNSTQLPNQGNMTPNQYTNMNQPNQATMHPNQYQYDPYSQSQANPVNPIPDVVPPYNQADLNSSFSQMHVSAPKSEAAANFGQDYTQTYFNVQYPQATTPNYATYTPSMSTSSSTNMVSSQTPSDYSSLNYPYSSDSATNGQNPNVSNPNVGTTNMDNHNMGNPNVINPNKSNHSYSSDSNQYGQMVNPNLANPSFTNPNMTNPSMANQTMGNPNMQNPNLTNQNMNNPNLGNPNMASPNLTNPNMANPNMINPHMANPNMAIPHMVNPQMINQNMTNPNMGNPNLTNPTIGNSNMTNPNVGNPNMGNPNLTNPTIGNPNMANPNLTNPTIGNPNMANPNLNNPTIGNPNMGNPNMGNPNLTNPTIGNPNMDNTNMSNPNVVNPYSSDSTQYGHTNIPNAANPYTSDQYIASSSHGNISQGYVTYTNAESTVTSTTNITAGTQNFAEEQYPNPALSHIDDFDQPIKSHVTGQALSTRNYINYGVQNIPTSQIQSTSKETYPTNAYIYPEQSNESYSQGYQNHPGFTFNSTSGGYDYSYGSQNAYTTNTYDANHGNTNLQQTDKGSNLPAHGVYTNAGSHSTLQSPSETPQVQESAGNTQIYYNTPYGYITNTNQAQEVLQSPQSMSTNYGANVNQSTYMQSGKGNNTNTTNTNYQVPTPTENVGEPNFDQTAQPNTGYNYNQTQPNQSLDNQPSIAAYSVQNSEPTNSVYNENVGPAQNQSIDQSYNADQTQNPEPTNQNTTPIHQNTYQVPTENQSPSHEPVKAAVIKEEKSENIPETKPEPSAFDLLSDIDFAVETKTLMPEIKVPQISESAIKKPMPRPEPVKKPVIKEEVIERPAKRDLFSDPSLLNQFTQEVKSLQRLTETLTNKAGAGLTVLDSKWKVFQDLQNKENMARSKTIAMQHTTGNIVTEVVPYDDSRLTLKSDPDAYINASYYKQLAPWCIPLVISKTPSEDEYSIFWKAVLENKISCVVCLLSEIEMQGKSYWPTAKGQSLALSNLKVTLDEVTCTVHWTERKLTVSSGKTVLGVTHYQINVFPAKIVCSPLVLLVDKILSLTYENRLSNQLSGAWVQCAAGAGRSTVVALLCMLVCQVRAGQLTLCDMLDESCRNLCMHRSNVLEDSKYLADAYRTALFYVQGVLCSGTTSFNGEAVSSASCASILPPVTPTLASSSMPKQKFSRESFEEMKQSPGLKSGDMKDPLNFLDPLWSLKKK